MNKKMYLSALSAAVVAPVMVVPIAQEAAAASVQFKDISKSSPYFQAVTEMVSKGIIMGFNDETYRPQTEITRVQVAILLERALPLEPVREAKTFNDVPKTYKHYDAIRKVQLAGIIDGTGNGNFNPEATLTRSQMAKILALGFNLEVKADYDFPDVPTSHWANKHVRALYSNGITVGDNGMYKPDESVTRGQYALFMYRLMNVDHDFVAKPIPKPEKPTPPVVKPVEPSKPVDPPVTKPEKPSKPVGNPNDGDNPPVVKPENPKPETPGDLDGHKPGDVVEGGLVTKPIAPEDNPEGLTNGMITEEYDDLSKMPKPDGYVEGVTEKKHEEDLAHIAKELGLKNRGEMTLNDMWLVDQRLIDTANLMNISVAQVAGLVNMSIEHNAAIQTHNAGFYYNFQKQIAIFVY